MPKWTTSSLPLGSRVSAAIWSSFLKVTSSLISCAILDTAIQVRCSLDFRVCLSTRRVPSYKAFRLVRERFDAVRMRSASRWSAWISNGPASTHTRCCPPRHRSRRSLVGTREFPEFAHDHPHDIGIAGVDMFKMGDDGKAIENWTSCDGSVI
jgi:hypothetical protein